MAKNDDIEVGKKYKAEIKVPISKDEIAEKDNRIRKNLTKIVHLKEDMKPTQEKVKALQEEIKQLRADCEDETELRTLYVFNEYHFKQSKVVVKRQDTGEKVEERAMTDDELQEFIPATGVGRGKLKSVPPDDEGGGSEVN